MDVRRVSGKVRRSRPLALVLISAALLLAGCGQSPQSLATRYLADLQQFNYPACYATLTDEERASRSLQQFLTDIPLAPDVDPIWFRAILFSTRYEVGEPQIAGERAVVPVKVTMPDLTLWERTIDAKAGPQDSLNAAADKSLQAGVYPKLRFEDALVMVKQQHQWRVVADFARRDLIRDGNREAVDIYHKLKTIPKPRRPTRRCSRNLASTNSAAAAAWSASSSADSRRSKKSRPRFRRREPTFPSSC